MALPLLNIAQAGLGLYQTYAGLRGLSRLGEYPDYSVSPELQKSYGRAEGMSTRGYSPEETAAFRQNLAGTSAQRYQRATDMAGGGLSQAIQGGINYGNIRGLVNFAADDASLHRRNIQYADSIARQIQGQKNLITQSQQDRYRQVEGAYGAEFTKGLENIVNPLNLTQAINFGNKNTSSTFPNFGGISLGNRPPAANLPPYQYPPITDYSTNAYGTGFLSQPYPDTYSDFSFYGQRPRNPYAPYAN